MAKSRAQREAEFRATHGVSSGTWYEMRRKAESRGISPTTFDKVFQETKSYTAAKQVTQTAADDLDGARYDALIRTGLIPKGTPRPTNDAEWFDLYDTYDIPDDYDWWYH